MNSPRTPHNLLPEDSVVIILPTHSTADTMGEGVAALIKTLCASPKRLSVVVLVPSPGETAAFGGRFPKAFIHAPQVGLTLGRLRARVILRIDPEQPAPRSFTRLMPRAVRRDIPVFGLKAATAQTMQDSIVDHPLTALSRSAADELPTRADLARITDHLISAMGLERGDGLVLGAATRIAQRLMRGPAHCLLAPMARRFPSKEALCDHLGRPKTIMCLGNGPTCADPRLADMPHDVLFRVNHQWMEDGYMTEADVLFAGVKKSMRAAGPILIAVASRRKEQALLGVRLLMPWRGRFRYVVVEDIAPIGDSLHGNPRPTTGAVMMAAAVALEPRRLIVAGMDMFSDRSGAYPGRPEAVNAYALSHDKGTDAAFIRQHLAHYQGEIITLSPEFAKLAKTVVGGRFALVEPAKG